MSRLHTSIGVLVLATLLAPTRLVAQTDEAVIGTWVLDLSQSTFGGTMAFYGGTAPTKRVMTFERVAGGIRHLVETIDRRNLGEVYRTQYTFQIDGKAYPADTQMPMTTVSFRRIDPRTIVRTGTYQGKVVETVTYRLSADGRTLTATQVGANRDAAGNEIPINTLQVFRRQ